MLDFVNFPKRLYKQCSELWCKLLATGIPSPIIRLKIYEQSWSRSHDGKLWLCITHVKKPSIHKINHGNQVCMNSFLGTLPIYCDVTKITVNWLILSCQKYLSLNAVLIQENDSLIHINLWSNKVGANFKNNVDCIVNISNRNKIKVSSLLLASALLLMLLRPKKTNSNNKRTKGKKTVWMIRT